VRVLAPVGLVSDESVDFDDAGVEDHAGDLCRVLAHDVADTRVDGVSNLLLAHVDLSDGVDGGDITLGERDHWHLDLLLYWDWDWNWLRLSHGNRHRHVLEWSLRLGHRLSGDGLGLGLRHGSAGLVGARLVWSATSVDSAFSPGVLLVSSLLVHEVGLRLLHLLVGTLRYVAHHLTGVEPFVDGLEALLLLFSFDFGLGNPELHVERLSS